MNAFKSLTLTSALLLSAGFAIAEAEQEEAEAPEPAAPAIEWETNMDDPPIGDPNARKGGTYIDYMLGYPKTFRLYGPNSNEAFANWNRPYANYISLVWRHPTTDNHVPILATHWSIQEDNKTVYYKLDERARWSDGEPITAHDYVFGREFLASPHIVDPFANRYIEDYIAEVEAVDDHTLKVVGTQESWRPLDDFAITPIPRHATKLEPGWPQENNYTPPVVPGPYTISDFTVGEKVVFARNPDWWGYDHHYFQGMFNPDRIEIIVLRNPDMALDYFKLGRLSTYGVYSARQWATQMDFDALDKGWVIRKQVFLEQPEGMSGIGMNLQVPLLQDKDFRKGLQYLFNFDELNRRQMFNAYIRKASAFEGTMFANPGLEPYGFNPREAGRHLRAAGFTQRGSDGILRRDDGTRASFRLLYGSESLTPHLEIVQQGYARAGVDIQLQLVEPVTAFERIRTNTFEAATISMTGGYYPAPHQYFSTEFKDVDQTNNFWNFGTEETDELINTYRFSMDEQERIGALHRLDEIIHDEAFHIPFWSAPYVRLLHWRHVKFPDFYLPRRAQSLMEYQVFWIDEEEQKRVEAARAEGRSLGADTVVEIDPYDVRERRGIE